jgi:hypothetical protein
MSMNMLGQKQSVTVKADASSHMESK